MPDPVSCLDFPISQVIVKSSLIKNIFILFSCLQLLSLKSKLVVQDEKTLIMAYRFVTLLTNMVGECNNSTVVILLLRFLVMFLCINLLSVTLCAKRMGPYILKLLTDAVALSNLRNDIS